MKSRLHRAFDQLDCLGTELGGIVQGHWWRWLTCWFGSSAGVIISYRLDRFFYLLLGDAWSLLRILFFPLFLLLRMLSANHQIHYKADLGKGLRILHPALGIVVSAKTTAGTHLTLTGGNCIGGRNTLNTGELVLGDHITLGANAVVLGPLTLGSRIMIGAGAVVLHPAPDDVILAGVPARIIKQTS